MFLANCNMQIRTRLTLQLLLSGGIILIIASVTIYLFSANFRKQDFHNRLRNKALSTANLFFVEYEVDAARFLRYEKDNPVNLHNEKIIILNSKNDTVYNSDEQGVIKIEKKIIEQLRSERKFSTKQGKYEVIGTLYITNYDSFLIFAAATDDEGYLHLEKLRILLVTVSIVCLFLFFIVGWFSSARAIKPLSDVVKKLEDISASSLNLRLFEGNKRDEIGRLTKTFNKMLERLEVSFTTQKNFIANASHELRTPLTSINGQLEVLLMKDRSSEEYKLEVESVLNDIKSLIGLSNRLLLLARTSVEGPMNLNKKIRIDEVLWQTKDDLRKFNKDYNINISIDKSLTDFDQMVVIGDEYLLKVAISNIVDNACKYSFDHTVHIRLHHFEKCIKLEFEDKGIGISEEGLQKVFDPFYRGNNTFSISGHGIGLPLANQIIKNHNGEIKLSSQMGKGTCVVVKLPTII
jgi:signal transduction histidine kinase